MDIWQKQENDHLLLMLRACQSAAESQMFLLSKRLADYASNHGTFHPSHSTLRLKPRYVSATFRPQAMLVISRRAICRRPPCVKAFLRIKTDESFGSSRLRQEDTEPRHAKG